jgi:hypothetical protein
MILAEIRSYGEPIDALRVRRHELDVSFSTLDQTSVLHLGYSSKVLAPGPVKPKHLGPVSLTAILGALGVKLALIEDREAMARSRVQARRRRSAS